MHLNKKSIRFLTYWSKAMDRAPLVSVITPLYNAEKYIAETIESVLSQTYTHWEMIIVDNGSTDKSSTIIQMFHDKRIKVITLKNNSGGPAKPRNIGVENAKGTYIAFLDSDDVWMPEKLQVQMETMLSGNYDIVHTLARTIDIQSNQIGIYNNQRIYNFCQPFMDIHTILYLSNYININSVLMKKESAICFREDKNMVAIEDWMYWIENSLASKKIYLIEEYLLKYRVDRNSTSDRSSDKSFRKAFYLYAILLIEMKISYGMFCFAGMLNFLRIGLRKFKNCLNKESK